MGATGSSLSRPSRVTSGEDLIANTKEVREMSNALFKFMYSSWDDREIWEIADKPEEYVIALSDMITQQFHILGYVTEKNHIGEIYFRKYSELKPLSRSPNLNTKTEDKEYIKRREKGIEAQRDNAKIIAFYFIRLFQILGSMLLVVKDISFPIQDKDTLQITDIGSRRVSRTDYRPLLTLPRFQAQQTGGDGTRRFPSGIPLGPFEFLRFYLRELSDSDITEYSTKYGIALDKTNTYQITPVLFFKYTVPSPLPSQVTPSSVKVASFLLITIQANTASSTIKRGELKSINVNISSAYPSSIDGFLSPSSQEDTSKQLERYHTNLTFDMKTGGSRVAHKATIQRTVSTAVKDSYIDGVEYRFDSGTNVDILIAQFDPKKDFKIILENLVLLSIRTSLQDKSIQSFKIKTDELQPVSAKDIGKLPDKFRNPLLDEFYQLLLNKDSAKVAQPHCIARALQLIDTTAIQQFAPTTSKTRICKFAVSDQTGPVQLSQYKQIKSIGQLFGKVNTAKFKDSQKVFSAFVGYQATKDPLTVAQLNEIGQIKEAQDLAAALKRLNDAFNYLSETSDKKTPGSLSEISVSRPKECKDVNEIQLSQPVTLQLQSAAQQLLAYHINHTIEISKFLQSIFNVTKDVTGVWKVEGPKTEILFAGFTVLDQLTDTARELLVDYYTGCETMYQKGVNIWKGSVAPVAPANAPKPVAPVAPVAPANAPKPVAPVVPVASVAPVTGGMRRL